MRELANAPFFCTLSLMDDLINYLSGFVTPERLQRFEQVLESRTRYFTVVLEDIYQSQNASAVVRTCDCFGIQDIHIIENQNPFKMDGEVALGAEKWVSIFRYRNHENNTERAIQHLRTLGYRIVATSPDKRNVSLDEFSLEKGRIALFFGTELTGISENVAKQADELIRIPMFGFTESYNISVSVALVLQNLLWRLQKSEIDWRLGSEEKKKLKLDWLRKSVKSSLAIERKFRENKK